MKNAGRSHPYKGRDITEGTGVTGVKGGNAGTNTDTYDDEDLQVMSRVTLNQMDNFITNKYIHFFLFRHLLPRRRRK